MKNLKTLCVRFGDQKLILARKYWALESFCPVLTKKKKKKNHACYSGRSTGVINNKIATLISIKCLFFQYEGPHHQQNAFTISKWKDYEAGGLLEISGVWGSFGREFVVAQAGELKMHFIKKLYFPFIFPHPQSLHSLPTTSP